MAAGPDAIYDRLVAEHQRGVLRVCRSILRDDHLGADAAQETFVRLWRRLVADRAPTRLGAWLRRVAITTSLDLRRRRSVREEAAARHGRDLAEGGSLPGRTDSVAEERVAQAELAESFERALERLSDGQRTVFLLRHAGGLRLAEVAETLDVSLSTVKTQFARACLKLQDALRPFEPRPDDEP